MWTIRPCGHNLIQITNWTHLSQEYSNSFAHCSQFDTSQTHKHCSVAIISFRICFFDRFQIRNQSREQRSTFSNMESIVSWTVMHWNNENSNNCLCRTWKWWLYPIFWPLAIENDWMVSVHKMEFIVLYFFFFRIWNWFFFVISLVKPSKWILCICFVFNCFCIIYNLKHLFIFCCQISMWIENESRIYFEQYFPFNFFYSFLFISKLFCVTNCVEFIQLCWY